jgi:glycosyltransferase involved in cell wall biosynthesis
MSAPMESAGVVFTRDVVGSRMAGPAIRAFCLARELSRHFPITLVATLDGSAPPEGPVPVDRRSSSASSLLRQARVVIGQPVRELLALGGGQKVVFDLFDPVILELQELFGPHPSLHQRFQKSRESARLGMALDRGDLLISGFRRQRDFYTGLRYARGAPPAQWLDRWIDLPFGIDPPEPGPFRQTDPPLVLWGGGVWEWLDSATAVEAIGLLRARDVAARLLFLGSDRPNDELRDLVGRTAVSSVDPDVEYRPGWVPYGEHHRFVEESRIALMLHRQTMEGEFSIRTRLFDAIRAAVPVITTAGGFASDLVENEGVGLVVAPGAVAEVAQAMERLLGDHAFHASCVANMRRIQPRFLWPVVAEPLIQALRTWL